MATIKNTIPEYEDEEIYANTSCEYLQNEDGNSPDSGGVQELKLSRENCGGGYYYVIKTNRWAFNNVQELMDVLKDFESKCG